MSPVHTNIGQSETHPSATRNNLKQLDRIVGGPDDNRRELKSQNKTYNLYINRISGEQTNYPVYEYIFNKSFATIKESDIIYFDDVIVKMKKEIEPLIYEFVETSENKEWLWVFPKFMEFLFFINTIWVWYDTEEEKFYLLSKQNPDDEKDNRYYDLLNHKEVILPVEEPIKCMWDGRDNAHFEMWFKECYRCVMREKALDQMWLINCKRLKISVDNAQDLRDVEHELLNINAYIGIIDNNTLPEPVELDSGALDSSVANHYLIWDRSLASLGVIANINQKAERKTTAENFEDMHSSICRQQAVLSQLKLFSKELEEIKSVKLEFKVLGAIEKTQDMMADESMNQRSNDNMKTQKNQDKPL